MNEMEAKSQLTVEVVRLILTDVAYQKEDWASLAVVYNFLNGRQNSYGYVFLRDGDWEARTPDDNAWDAMDKMLELQAAMERETGRKWIKALVLINRADESLDIKFEYDDPKKWVISPGNLDASVAVLKS